MSDRVRDDLASLADDRRDELARWWKTADELTVGPTETSYVDKMCSALLSPCRGARSGSEHVYVRWGF